MYQKNCENCHRPSYSSSEIGKWLCPVCGNDLTNYPFFDAMTIERINIKTNPYHQKMESYQQTQYRDNVLKFRSKNSSEYMEGKV